MLLSTFLCLGSQPVPDLLLVPPEASTDFVTARHTLAVPIDIGQGNTGSLGEAKRGNEDSLAVMFRHARDSAPDVRDSQYLGGGQNG